MLCTYQHDDAKDMTMFTGIITDIGCVAAITQNGDLTFQISTAYDTGQIMLGASIACDGICLTVTQFGDGWFAVDVSAETASKTTIGDWGIGRKINLERALKMGDELGGHIVSGHVDGVAKVLSLHDEGASTRVVFDAPADLAKFIAPKGSVTLNGTSLTVNAVNDMQFGINLIAHTKQATTWGDIRPGDRVNLEIDTLARYVARLAEWQADRA
jgi:riboflavin synthase